MNTIETQETIAAPCDPVFAAFTDLRNAAERIRGIESLEVLTEGPIRVGTQFRETRIMMGRKATEIMTITALEPPSRYVIEAKSCGCHYVSEFVFEPITGGTRVTCRFCGTAISVFAKCMMFVMKPLMKKMHDACRNALQQDMQDLKTEVESSST